MQIKQSFEHKLIQKAIKRYQYNKLVDRNVLNEEFYDDYLFFSAPKELKKPPSRIFTVFSGTPNCNHITAKKMLFQGDNECWKYFGRTAQFWSFQYIDTKATTFIDHISFDLGYALYVERYDLVKLLLEKLNSDMDGDGYKSDSAYIKQQVYPSTYLTHFIVEKLGLSNSAFDKVLHYGSGLGIYERIVNAWESAFRDIEDEYWNSLCEYHLNGIGVTGTKRKDEEFLDFGLIPMELINLFKARRKLGLDVPEIKHELFATPMAVFPKIPTGYNPQLDVKFQLVERTKRDIKRYTYEDIAKQLEQEYGENIELFF